MHNSHRATGSLPDEWSGPPWPRWSDYHVIRPGQPEWRGPEWYEGVFDPGSGREGEFYDVKTYDPVAVAPQLLDDALRVACDDDDALLGFVRRWGVPGVGTGEAGRQARVAAKLQSRHSFDTVWAVRRLLREVQRHFAWSRALLSREMRSPSIPSLWGDQDACLEAALVLVPPPERGGVVPHGDPTVIPTLHFLGMFSGSDPYLAAFAKGHYLSWCARTQVRPRDREQAYWRAFGESIAQHLTLIHPAIRWANGRAIAAWTVRRPADALWAQIWNLATGGGAIRQCRHCSRWFAVDHGGKVYCSRVCTNRASAKASYERKRKARSQPRRKRR